jgi:hypothetical protein
VRSDIQASLDAIKAPAQAIITKVDNIPAAVEAGEQAAYDEGFQAGKVAGVEEGRNSIQLPDETNTANIYTQEQMNTAVSERETQVRTEMQLSVDEKQAAIDSLNAQITDLNTKLMAAGPDAVAAFKAELKAKYEEQQVAETEGETGFKSLFE